MCGHKYKEEDESQRQFLAHARGRNYSHSTLESYSYSLKTFRAFLSQRGVNKMQDVQADELTAFRLWLVDSGLKPNTQEIHLSNLRAFFNWLEKTGAIFLNPARGLVIQRPERPLLPVPTEAEMRKLLAQPDLSARLGIRDRALLETAYSTGARREELWRMNALDPDLREGRVRILGKTRKERVVPLGRQAVHWLKIYIGEVRPQLLKGRLDQEALWLGKEGQRLGPQSILAQIRRHARAAGIKTTITPHTLRRACATHMLRGGAHPVQVQMLLGHATLTTLGQYLRVTIRDLIQTHRSSNPGK